MTRRDLLQQLAAASVDLSPVLMSASAATQLTAVCTTARLAFGAAAVSVAVVADGLHYVSAAGEGAAEIVGTTLPLDRGLGGYVAVTGQAMAVDRPSDDPRFARDVAESTGYVPSSLLAVPIEDASGDIIGVLTALDRTIGSADSLALATSFADQLTTLLPTIADTSRGARLLLETVVDAVRAGDTELADALARALADLPAEDADIAAAASVLARLRHTDPVTRERTVALITGLVELATAKRRR